MASRSVLTSFDRAMACGICERTILLGEQPLRFIDGAVTRTVCRLCVNEARANGWLEEGRATPPPISPPASGSLFERVRNRTRTAPEPDLADLTPPGGTTSADELTLAATRILGVETFNESPYRGTVSGIAKSLGQARVSVVAFGGRRPGAAITIAWDLSWYRYLIEPSSSPNVRLDERGESLKELSPRWQEWNARALEDGSIELVIKPPARRGKSGERKAR